MAEEFYTVCACGHRRRVSENAVGLSGRCPKCGKELIITEDSLVPADSLPEESEGDFEEAVLDFRSPEEGQTHDGSGCARCGRPFRGDWDRYHTPAGLFCNRCANMVHHASAPRPQSPDEPPPLPGLTPAQQARLVEIENAPPPVYKPRETLEPEPDLVFGIEREKFKNIVLGLGIAVVVLCIVVAMFDSGPGAPQEMDQMVTEQAATPQDTAPEEPAFEPYVYWLVTGIRVLIGLVGEFWLLYFALKWTNSLPNDTFGANLVAVGVMALAIQTLDVVPILIPHVAVSLLCGFGQLALILYLIIAVYRLSFTQIIMYAISRILLGFALKMLATMLMGVLGMIFT